MFAKIYQTFLYRLDVPVSTPQPRLQTPFYSEQSKVTNSPFTTASAGSNNQNAPKVDVVYSGEGNLLSQTIGQTQQRQHSQSIYSGGSQATNQNIQQTTGQHVEQQKQTLSFESNRLSASGTSSTNQGTPVDSRSSFAQTTKSIPSTPTLGQGNVNYSNQQSSASNIRASNANGFSSNDKVTTYRGGVSFGQNLSTSSGATSTTSIPYSPSVPPFRSSTITTTYTPTPTSYNQQSQALNSQSPKSSTFAQVDSGSQPAFSINQFQIPAKEYLPSLDNTRTARTNELSFGNHGSSTKLSSSQNFRGIGNNQQDARQQFTYPVDQVIDAFKDEILSTLLSDYIVSHSFLTLKFRANSN